MAEEAAGGWDQVTYPAAIQYADPNNFEVNITSITENILIEVDETEELIHQLGRTAAQNLQCQLFIHIYIYVKNAQATFLTIRAYLNTVRAAFEAWLKAKATTSMEIISVLVNTMKMKADIVLKVNEFRGA